VGGALGDIAIDDITATKGACPPNANVDFEEQFDWTIDTSGRLNWTVGSNGQLASGTGPQLDHTFGSNSGHYLYLDASHGNTGTLV
jgi:hypothetical protein